MCMSRGQLFEGGTRFVTGAREAHTHYTHTIHTYTHSRTQLRNISTGAKRDTHNKKKKYASSISISGRILRVENG